MLPKLELCNLNVGDLVVFENKTISIVEKEGFMFFKRKVLSLEKRLESIPMKKFTHMYQRYNCFVVEKQDKEYEFYKSYIVGE